MTGLIEDLTQSPLEVVNGRAPDEPSLRDRLLATTELLQEIARSKDLLSGLSPEERVALLNAAGDVFCADPEERRLRVKAKRNRRRVEKLRRDEEVLGSTGIRVLRDKPVFTTPNVFPPEDFEQHDVEHPDFRETADPQHCYICKAKYHRVHHFYDQLCPECADLNYAKRTEPADLSGTVAILTGARVKIGYQAGIRLLRSGAELIAVTRFPRNAAARYAAEEDFDEWGHRLEVFGLDLRHTPSVESFCQHILRTRDRLDFIINNACQTVRRPPDFYRHMMEEELAAAVPALPGVVTNAAELSQTPLLPEELVPQTELFPAGMLDQDLQQVDLRGRNSWRLLLHEVSTVELLETQLVNAVAPFVLNARLKPLMERTPGRSKHIVNVSAVEGQFYRRFKTTRHPHTNMAKAALNMMTRTSATDYHASGIHMNAVDTGWVSDEDPIAITEQKREEHRFHPPLDIVDGAARIVDPIIAGYNTGEHMWGQFLKDFQPTDW